MCIRHYNTRMSPITGSRTTNRSRSIRSRKLLILLFMLCTCSLPVSSQLNVQLGAGIADMGFQYEGEFNYFGYELSSMQHSIPAFSYFAGVSYTFLPESRLQPGLELQYSREGLNYSKSYLFDDIGYHVRIDYLKMPVLLHITLNRQNGRHPEVHIGPYVSFRMRAVRDLTLYGERNRRNVDNVNPFDMGIIAGFSRRILPTPFPLDAGFRISYSLVNSMSPLGGSLMRYYGASEEYVRNITMMFTLSTPIVVK